MRLVIRGHHLPGRRCGAHDDVHVGLQVGREPEGLVAGDADHAVWVSEIQVHDGDFRPAVLTDDTGMPRCARLRPPALRIG